MAVGITAGVGGVNQKIKKITAGVGGANREIKSAWAGVGGMNRKVFSSGIPLGGLPIGTRVKDLSSKYYGAPIVWKIIDHNHSGYPANCTTFASDRILCLKCVDGMEPSNSNLDRKTLGNNRYMYSNLRQWLNSAASAGSWYSAQHSSDAPPAKENVPSNKNAYNTEAGFQNAFSSNMRSALLPTNLAAEKNNLDGGGTDTFVDRVFLASCTEMGIGNPGGIICGIGFTVFSSNSARLAYPTPECVSNSEYKALDNSLSSSWVWSYWLRDAYYNVNDADLVHLVYTDGYLDRDRAAREKHGVRPFCNLSSEITVRETPDSDGTYIIQF